MFFTNPILIICGMVPLESSTEWEIFYVSNAMMMLGIDLFIVGAKVFHNKSLSIQRLPRQYIASSRVNTCIICIVLLASATLGALIASGYAKGVDVFVIHKDYRATGNQAVFYMLANYGTILMPIAAFLLALKTVKSQAPYWVLFLAVILIHFMIFRVRTLPVALAMGYGLGIIARYYFCTLGKESMRARLPAFWRYVVLVGIPMIVIGGISVKYVRASYQMQDWSYSQERIDLLVEQTFAGGDLGYAYFTRRAVDLFPRNHDFLMGESYYRLLFTPIPRFIWPDKPVSTNRIFAAVLDRDYARRGQQIPPGAAGTLYINFGHWGIGGMFIFGALFARERYASLWSLLILSGSGIWLFKFVRGEPSGPIIFLAFIAICSFLILLILRPVPLATCAISE